MADYEDTKVKDLIINNMSQEKFEELKTAGELDPTQLYCTPEEGGSALPDQTDNAGKFLTTDGTTASWGNALVNESALTGALAIGGATADSYGVALGLSADARVFTVSVGASSRASAQQTVGIGGIAQARAQGATAIGYNAVVSATNAIQLGAGGTNLDSNTFKVANVNGNFEIMSADGTMPTDRYTTTPTDAGTYVPKLTIAEDGTTTREWGAESGGASLPDQTGNAGKFLTTDGTDVSWGEALVNKAIGDKSITLLGAEGYPYAVGNIVFGYGASVGYNQASTSQHNVVIGSSSRVRNGSYCVCIGYDSGDSSLATFTNSIAIGYNAKVGATNAIQIGTGTNSDSETFKVGNANGNFEMMDANGNVPRERLKNLVEVLPTADNGYTTVKNFGNGYVEITGYASIGTVGAGTGSEVQIDLPAGYTMADTNYWVNIAPTSETTMFDFKAEAKARSTTHFMVAYKNEDTVTGLTAAGVYWEVRGMLATE